MTDLTNLTIVDAKALLLKREITAVELADAHLTKVELSKLNAFITITHDIAIAQAKNSDKKIQQNNAGILEGIPIGVKDLFCTKGVLTTAGSHILDGFQPEYESTITAKLFENGGVMIGKTNMDEFAMGSTTSTSYYGPTLNPWQNSHGETNLVPGGSSGGSSSAVAGKLCMGALGSDTGGSIRQPASFCGIVGMKPTYGRCSRWGMIAFASSLDQAGVFARTVEDSALMLQSIVGYDVKDSTSVAVKSSDFTIALGQSIKGLKIGIPKEYRVEGMHPDILKVWDAGIEWLREAGAEIVEISLPHTSYAVATYYIIAPAEASSNLGRFDGVRYGLRCNAESGRLDDMYKETRMQGFGVEVKRRIMIGTYVLSSGYYDAYYIKAQKVRRLVYDDFQNAFNRVDAIFTPTTPSTAFSLTNMPKDPVTMYLNDVFTIPASLAGLPAISVPAGIASDGLPLGLQLIGKHYNEEMVFKIASIVEKCANIKSI